MLSMFGIKKIIRHRAPARSVCGFRLLSSQLDSSKILDSELELLLEGSTAGKIIDVNKRLIRTGLSSCPSVIMSSYLL